jgi:hypothetical protein
LLEPKSSSNEKWDPSRNLTFLLGSNPRGLEESSLPWLLDAHSG